MEVIFTSRYGNKTEIISVFGQHLPTPLSTLGEVQWLHGPAASSPFSAGEKPLKAASLLRSAESQEEISHSLSMGEFRKMMNYLLDTPVIH